MGNAQGRPKWKSCTVQKDSLNKNRFSAGPCRPVCSKDRAHGRITHHKKGNRNAAHNRVVHHHHVVHKGRGGQRHVVHHVIHHVVHKGHGQVAHKRTVHHRVGRHHIVQH